MSLDFFDRNGRPYAYSDDGETIYTFSGKPVAYIHGGSIFGFNGRHIGFFQSGTLHDRHGHAVLFTPGASGGPMKPMRQMTPMKAMKAMRPMKAMRQMAPMRPMQSMSWSQYRPADLFEA